MRLSVNPLADERHSLSRDGTVEGGPQDIFCGCVLVRGLLSLTTPCSSSQAPGLCEQMLSPAMSFPMECLSWHFFKTVGPPGWDL